MALNFSGVILPVPSLADEFNSTPDGGVMLNVTINCTGRKAITDLFAVKCAFFCLYLLVFLISISGNSLVVYVVLRSKQMQTVTNFFIANLAVSDLMVCCTSLWLTPVYTYLGHWVWGGWLCYGLPLFQGTFIFISTLTLMSIALDRYFVICRQKTSVNVNEHMSMQVCIAIVTLIWMVSLLLVMPYAVHMRMAYVMEPCNFYLCVEDWAMEDLKSFYGIVVLSLQFLVPFTVIGYSYTSIWCFLDQRKSLVSERESEYETQRKRRLLRMLITMVVLFATGWLPFNLLNILRDLKADRFLKPYFSFLFLLCHLISMSTTVYNPLLYAWMNQTFRAEFIRALPFLANIFRHCCSFRPEGGSGGGGGEMCGSGGANSMSRRPRIITDCEPASNRRNCADHVRDRKLTLLVPSPHRSPSMSQVRNSGSGKGTEEPLIVEKALTVRRSGSLGAKDLWGHRRIFTRSRARKKEKSLNCQDELVLNKLDPNSTLLNSNLHLTVESAFSCSMQADCDTCSARL